MRLKMDILPAGQRALWDELSEVPGHFTLYGGTAIALQLGHRQSVDFDFFAFADLDPEELLRTIPFLGDARVLRVARNTLSVLVERAQEPVRVSFFGVPRLRCVLPPRREREWPVALAALPDLAGMKVATIPRRVEVKDYLDIHAIWRQTDITPEQAFAAAAIIYGERFNPMDALKALVWFEEEELAALPEEVRAFLKEAARNFDHDTMARELVRLQNGAGG